MIKKRYLLWSLALILTAGACSSGPATSAQTSQQPPQVFIPSIENLENLQNSFRGLVQAVLPSVVRIDVVEVTTRNQDGPQTNPFFEFFFGRPEGNQSPREFRAEGLGSGVIVRRDGNKVFVLTNAHVIGTATEIRVTLDDQREFMATLVGRDDRKDLALVSFETTDQDIVIARLGDSDSLHVGDWVLAMGTPFGFQSTVTAGIISALNRTGGPGGNISDFIQTDAAINRGNSGGALVNLQGEVIGINTWITTQTGGSVGLGFAVPINNARRAIDDFINFGTVQYGWLGVSITSVDRTVQESMGLDTNRGALVNSVYRSSPGGRGGVLPGDFITHVNGRRITSSEDLVLRIGELPVGRNAELTLIRDGRSIDVTVDIVTRESEDQIAGQAQDLWTGASVFPITDRIRTDQNLGPNDQGVMVTQVVRRSPAAIAGMQSGDRIISVNGNRVTTLAEYFRALNSRSTGDIEFRFVRDGVELMITIVKN